MLPNTITCLKSARGLSTFPPVTVIGKVASVGPLDQRDIADQKPLLKGNGHESMEFGNCRRSGIDCRRG